MAPTQIQIRSSLEGERRFCQSVLITAVNDAINELKRGRPGEAVAWLKSRSGRPFGYEYIVDCLYDGGVDTERMRAKLLERASTGPRISLPRVRGNKKMPRAKRTNLEKVCGIYEGVAGTGGKKLIVCSGGRDVIFNFGGEKLKGWKGIKTSDMAFDHEGRKILKWLLTIDVDKRAKEIITEQISDALLLF